MNENEYQVTGFQHGTFAGADGHKVSYCNLFCIAPITGTETDDFHFEGHKAFTFKCASPDVLDGIKPKDHVQLYFNQRQRVVLATVIK